MASDPKKRILETYQQTADKYDTGVSERLGEARFGIESLTRLMLRDMTFSETPRILDLACGTGLSTFPLIDWIGKGDFHGVDLSPEMIKKAGENAKQLGYQIDLQVGDAENLPYPDDYFDAITSVMSFQMFTDKLRVVKEMYRVLRPGGMVGLLYCAGDHLRELISLCKAYGESKPDLDNFNKAVNDVNWMHIGLEKTQRLFWEAGLRRPLIYGYHRIMHVKPRFFWETNPYPDLWRTHIPIRLREKVESEIIELMTEGTEDRGFKLTWYTIQAYGMKHPRK